MVHSRVYSFRTHSCKSGLGKSHHNLILLTLRERIVQRPLEVHSPFVLPHSQDGEIDLKLLTKVLAPEQEVREVCSNSSFSLPQPSPSCNQLAPQAHLRLPTDGRWAWEGGCDCRERPSCVSPSSTSLGRTTSAGTGTVSTLRCPQSSSPSGTCCRQRRRTLWDSPHTPEPAGDNRPLFLHTVTSALDF